MSRNEVIITETITALSAIAETGGAFVASFTPASVLRFGRRQSELDNIPVIRVGLSSFEAVHVAEWDSDVELQLECVLDDAVVENHDEITSDAAHDVHRALSMVDWSQQSRSRISRVSWQPLWAIDGREPATGFVMVVRFGYRTEYTDPEQALDADV